MNTLSRRLSTSRLPSRNYIAMAIAVALLTGGCATTMESPAGAVAARTRLVQLQNNPQLAQLASVAIREADAAVTQAEVPIKDKALSSHLVFLAGRQVDIAWAQAEKHLLEDQRSGGA